MARKSKTYSVKAEQVQQAGKGWLLVTLSDGSTVKARKSQVRILGEGLLNRRIGDRKYDCSGYVRKVGGKALKSAGGNATMDNGDDLARQLRGAELDEVYKTAAKLLGESQAALRAKYGHLNVGMQRMNLGNRMRAASHGE